jgi:hypothetical protein
MDYCDDMAPEGALNERDIWRIARAFGLAVVDIKIPTFGTVVVLAEMRDQFAERAAKALEYMDFYRPCGVLLMIEPAPAGA